MCFYFDRFVMFHGKANIHEFFFYAVVIFSTISCVWLRFRHMEVEFYILFLIELAILIHFAGGFIEVDGNRLYEYRFFTIRYDKFVHLVNSIFATLVFLNLFKKNNYPMGKFTCMVTVFCVLGFGALIEIQEFIVALTVDDNGVGTYVNNMLDLVANLIGSLIGILFYQLYTRYQKV